MTNFPIATELLRKNTVGVKQQALSDVEEIDARAILGVTAHLSEMEIEAAYRRRANEVRKRFDDAKENSTRTKCRRERAAIEEARRTLLLELDEQKRRQREEQERLATEQRQREEQERRAAELRQREEQERLDAEQRQREEQERRAAELRQREEQERLDAEQRQREEQERLDAEQRQRKEQERLDAELRQREEQERLDAEQRQREEQERLAAELRRREEQERLAAELRQREEQEHLAAELRLRQEQEHLAAELRLRQEQERLATEQRLRQEQERLATEQRQHQEQERPADEQRRREEQERLAAEQRQREEEERLAVQQRQRDGRNWFKQNIRLFVGGLILVLACTFAAVSYWLLSQNEKKLGRLVLKTLPAHANVYIDGVFQGTTPLVLDRIVPGERNLQIELEDYQDEHLIVLIKPGDQRFFPPVTLSPKKKPIPTATPVSVTPTATPIPTMTPFLVTPTATPFPINPTPTPTPSSTTIPPTPVAYLGEKYPQTRERVLTEAEVAHLDYAELRYAINEMYARHGARFIKEPDVRKQFEQFSWYYPIPELTLAQIDAEFSRIESQNRDLLARLRDQKRPR